MNRQIYGEYDAHGYAIVVLGGDGELLYEYRAGNNWYESSSQVELSDNAAVPVEQLQKWCGETLGEMAVQFGAEICGVYERTSDVYAP